MIKHILSLVMVAVVVMAVGVGCASSSESAETGTLVLKLTDAPVDDESIAGVYIAINKIEVNKSTSDNANWETLINYLEEDKDDDGNPDNEPFVCKVSDLIGGESALLGESELTAGQYNQIRFILDIQEEGQEPPVNPGCYVEFTEQSEKDDASLFVPSGQQSGYKAVGAFEVPVNGDVEVTVDFDLRKSLHITGEGNSQRYILQPTLRLVVDSEAGNISGMITLDTEYNNIIVFAYEDGTWAASEASDPAEGESRFPNAVTSYSVDLGDEEDDNYVLAYLTYGTYDLVVTGYNGATFGAVLGTVSDVVLDSNHTNMPIDSDNLEAIS